MALLHAIYEVRNPHDELADDPAEALADSEGCGCCQGNTSKELVSAEWVDQIAPAETPGTWAPTESDIAMAASGPPERHWFQEGDPVELELEGSRRQARFLQSLGTAPVGLDPLARWSVVQLYAGAFNGCIVVVDHKDLRPSSTTCGARLTGAYGVTCDLEVGHRLPPHRHLRGRQGVIVWRDSPAG